MPRFYLTSPIAAATVEVTHRQGTEGELFDLAANPVNAHGAALHITGLTRAEAEAWHSAFGQALQDADVVATEGAAMYLADDHAEAQAFFGNTPILPRDCSGGPLAEMGDLSGAIHSNDHEEHP